jgi:YVTN family beta-propeller protein
MAPASRPRIYVSNEQSGDVSVVDPLSGQVVSTIPVGKRPRGIRLSHDGKLLFVAVTGSSAAPPGQGERETVDPSADGIAVVDLASGRKVRVLESGNDPEAFDLSPDGRTLYVSDEAAGTLGVVDIAHGKLVRTVPVGEEPEGVRVTPDGSQVYVTCEGSQQVVVVGLPNGDVLAKIRTGPRPRGVIFTPDGSWAFVTNEQGHGMTVIDPRTLTAVKDIPIDLPRVKPMGLALAPDGRTLYVTGGRGGTVSWVDVASMGLQKTVEHLGARLWGVGVSADGRNLFATDGPANEVVELEAQTGEILRHIAVGRSPWGIAISR